MPSIKTFFTLILGVLLIAGTISIDMLGLGLLVLSFGIYSLVSDEIYIRQRKKLIADWEEHMKQHQINNDPDATQDMPPTWFDEYWNKKGDKI